MDKRTYKNKIYEQLARLVKALANPRRLEILELLAQGSHAVEQIAGQTDMSVANTSQHLQTMKRAQLVGTRREGVTVYYHLDGENVFRVWKALRNLGMEKNAEIERILQEFRKSREALDALTISELKSKIRNDQVSIVDVRPEEEFDKGHIASALSIPVDQLEKRMKELPENDEIVVYCRGPFCVFADDAVKMLKARGYNVKRLEEGYPDWALMGLDIETNKEQ